MHFDSVSTLGIPLVKESTNDDFASKIGGFAIWHEEETAPADLSEIFCENCKSSANVVLVAQVYTPMDYDRSIYIFACNTRACSIQSKGWRAIRNQSNIATANTICVPSVTPKVDNAITPTVAKDSVWQFLSNDDNCDIDLEKLLNERDNSLLKPANEISKKASATLDNSKFGTVNMTKLITSTSLPCFYLEEVDEIWDGGLTATNNDQYRDKHTNALLESYLECEEDVQLKSLLHKISTDIEIVDEDDNDEDEEKSEHQSIDSDEESTVANGKESSDASHPSASSSISRIVELYFQRRVQSQPRQVLRYAFEGQPLWITHPNPLGSQPFFGDRIVSEKNPKKAGTERNHNSEVVCIPCCELCGAPRVFEMQLMPALLSFIAPKQQQQQQQQQPVSLQELLGSGLDFGVAAVYVCRDSCCLSLPSKSGRRFASEVVVLQPPPDLY
mmetsp:Transcript_8548/g.12744  ORF Transcript_8548/g.12744 Transcript_8548/m.12744 type:complete len:445 (-) Transcript_8548:250-1584(-)